MKLPGADRASVPEDKIHKYLLALDHSHGRFKAEFFARFGFEAHDARALIDALKRHARIHNVTSGEETPFGMRYTVDGELDCPDGRRPVVRSVWFIEYGESAPRLVTAYPLKRRTG